MLALFCFMHKQKPFDYTVLICIWSQNLFQSYRLLFRVQWGFAFQPYDAFNLTFSVPLNLCLKPANSCQSSALFHNTVQPITVIHLLTFWLFLITSPRAIGSVGACSTFQVIAGKSFFKMFCHHTAQISILPLAMCIFLTIYYMTSIYSLLLDQKVM